MGNFRNRVKHGLKAIYKRRGLRVRYLRDKKSKIPTVKSEPAEASTSSSDAGYSSRNVGNTQESVAEVELLDIKEEIIDETSPDQTETNASNEDPLMSNKVHTTEIVIDPIPLKIEVLNETETHAQVPIVNTMPLMNSVPNMYQNPSVPTANYCTTNTLQGSQTASPLAVPGVSGAEEVEMWTLDDDDKFGLSIARSIKSLSDDTDRNKLKAAIQSVVIEFVAKDVKKKLSNTSFTSEATPRRTLDPWNTTFGFRNKDSSLTLVCTRKSVNQNK